MRIVNEAAPQDAFDRAFANADHPTLAPIDRGAGWVVVLPEGVDRALERLRSPAAAPSGIVLTVRGEGTSRAVVDREPPRAAVVIPPAAIRELTPDLRSAAAGLAGLPLSTLDGLAAADLPLVLQTHRRASTARHAAATLARETGLPVQAATGGGVLVAMWTASLALTAVMTGLGTLTFALLGFLTLPLLGTLLTLGLSAFAVQSGWSWNTHRALLAGAREAEREAAEERARRSSNPRLARAWSSLAEARIALAAANLPGAASSDLRGVLKAVEQELEELEARQRRATGDAAARVDAEARRIDDVLTEVATAIGRWQTDNEDAALDAIVAATRHARERHLAGA